MQTKLFSKAFFHLAITMLLNIINVGSICGATFTKITSMSDLTTGDYVIVGEKTSTSFGRFTYAAADGSGRVAYSEHYTNLTLPATSITTTTANEIWHITVSGTGSSKTVTIYNSGQSKYLAASSSLSWVTSSPTSWTVTYSSGFQFAASTTYLGVNKSANYWRDYASGTLTNTYGIFLYKAPSAPHKVTFDAEGGSCGTSYLNGSNVTLPSASPSDACSDEGWVFYGWATSACSSSTTTPPTIVGTTGNSYVPEDDITLHAVYRQFVSGPTTTTYTINGNWTSSNGDWTKVSGTDLGEHATGKWGLKAVGSSTATSPSSYSYISNISFSGSKSKTGDGSVEFLYGSGSDWITLNSAGFSNSLSWSPSNVDGQLKIVFTNTAGNTYIASIAVTYKTFNYHSSPVCCEDLDAINGSIIVMHIFIISLCQCPFDAFRCVHRTQEGGRKTLDIMTETK